MNSNLRFFSNETIDRPIFENDEFVCVATLGSIIPGWCLISPKRKVLNLAELSEHERNSLSVFSTEIQSAIEKEYGFWTMFEHGPKSAGSKFGCGIDQAHLHIAPVQVERLTEVVKSTELEWSETPSGWPNSETIKQRDYLWLSDGKDSMISFPDQPISQFFRKCVAQIANVPNQWNYKTDAFLHNVAITQAKITTASSEGALVQ